MNDWFGFGEWWRFVGFCVSMGSITVFALSWAIGLACVMGGVQDPFRRTGPIRRASWHIARALRAARDRLRRPTFGQSGGRDDQDG